MKLLISLFILTQFVSCSSTPKGEKTPEEKKAEIYYNQGTQQMMDQEYTQALKNLLSAKNLSPNDDRINNNLGMAFYFKGAKNRAIKYIKKALELNPKNTDAKMNLATIYLQEKKYAQAEGMYLQVLDDLTYEGQYKTYYNLGLLNLKLNQETKAINYFKQSVNVSNSYCPSHFQLGDIYFKRKDYKKALNSYRDAGLGVCFEKPEPIYKQALSLIKLKRYESAKSKLEELVKRFAETKYERMAQAELDIINKRNESRLHEEMKDIDENYVPNRNILSPDF